MTRASELLTAVEKLFEERSTSEVAAARETQFVAGRTFSETRLLVLFRWLDSPAQASG